MCALGQRKTPSISLSRQRVHGLQVPILKGFKPNEANAIDYVQSEGHELRAHFDDRSAHPLYVCGLCMLALPKLPVAATLPPSGCPAVLSLCPARFSVKRKASTALGFHG